MNGNHSLSILLAEIAEISWDIICFSETRAADADMLLMSGHRLLNSRGHQLYAGVSILVHSRWAEHILEFEQVSGRMVYADISIGGKIYRTISTYFPHAGYPWSEFKDCLHQLKDIVQNARGKQIKCMIGGDFNTEIGRGDRSAEMLAFVSEMGLQICNANDEEHLELQWTFRSCLGRLRRLDYILIDDDMHLTHAGPADLPDMGSDHRAVRSCISIPLRASSSPKKNRPKKTKNIDWEAYTSFIEEEDDTNRAIPQTIPALEGKLLNVAGSLQNRVTAPKEKYLTEAQRLIRLRRCCVDSEERKRLTKQIWRECRREMRVRRAQQTTQILSEFKGLCRLDAIHRQPVIRSSGGGPNLYACAEMLAKVYTSDMPTEDPLLRNSDTDVKVPDFSPAEVRQAMAKMSKGRASDQSGMVLEMFMYGGERVVDELTALFGDQKRNFHLYDVLIPGYAVATT